MLARHAARLLASRPLAPCSAPRLQAPRLGTARPARPHCRRIRAMAATFEDPRDVKEMAEPKPKQQQSHPGMEKDMEVRPDYGYDTYKGTGKLKDKIALITGGDSGIGRAVALAYAREGADVAIAYLNEHEDAEETQRVVEEAGRKAVLIPGDLSEESHCKHVVDETLKAFGRGPDILVNNASYQGEAVDDFVDIPRERLEHTFRTNILGMFSLAQKCVPHMAPGSCIINVGSVQAYNPTPQILDYSASKGAITTFTKGLNTMILPSRGIRVNQVAPGPIWTPLIVQSFPEEKVEKFGGAPKTPLGRPAHPREVAPAFVFLACNDDSSYISGEILGVAGGRPMP